MQPTLIVSSGLNGRSGARERVHPSGEQPDVQLELLPAGLHGRRPLVQARRLLARFEHDVDQPHRRLRARSGIPTVARRTTARWRRRAARSTSRATATASYDLLNYAAYVQDTVTHGHATLQLGVRYDYNKDKARSGQHRGQPARRSVAAGDQLPRRRSWRGVQQLLAAPRPDLRPAAATARRWRAPTTRATTARSATAASPARSTRSARRRCGIRGSTPTATASRGRRRDHAERQTAVGEHQLVGGQPGQHGVGQLGRPEPEERHDRRVHRRRGSRNRAGLRRRAPATSGAGTATSRGAIARASPRPTGSPRPSRRRRAPARATTARASARRTARRSRYFQPAFQQPTVVTLTNVPDFNRSLQRLRAERPQADVQPLDDEHQLRLQQHDRELRLVPGQPAEHRRRRRSARIRRTAISATATSTTT